MFSFYWNFFCLVFVVKVTSGTIEVPKWKLNNDREIPAIALGTWLGHNTQGRIQPQSDEVQKAVEWAIDAGYRHIDTAYIYGVEDQVGRGIASKISQGAVTREDVFVTTKLWNDAHARDAVVPALRRSLKNLNLDYVDLYLIHWPVGQFRNLSYDYTDYVDTWRGMEEALALGLTRSIGVSNFNEEQILRIEKECEVLPAVLQVELNLNLQQPSLLSFCRNKSIAVMGYTPFGSLFPSKAKEDSPPPRVDDQELVKMAAAYKKSVTQVVLRYLFELGVIAIPKSITKSRIEENLDIFDFQLKDEDKAALRAFDKHYRTIPQYKWMSYPHYPFEKKKQ